MKRYAVLVLMVMSLLMTGCDPSSGEEYWIDNKSDSEIFVVVKYYQEDLQKHVIERDGSFLVGDFNFNGRLQNCDDTFSLNAWDSISILIDTVNATTIKKDYRNKQSWECSQRDKGKFGIIDVGTNVHRIGITNEDIK